MRTTENNFDSKENDLFDKDFKSLSHEEALKLLGNDKLQSTVKSPWQVVILQCWLTVVITVVVALVNVKLNVNGVVISVLAGSFLGVFPKIAFIIMMELKKSAYKRSAKRFVHALFLAEVIKITLSLIIIYAVVMLVPQLVWLPFLGMYIITLQANWLQGIKFEFNK